MLKRVSVKEFFVWMRNGIAFCYSWLVFLVIIGAWSMDVETVSVAFLLKLLLFVVFAVFIFTVFFSKIFFKKLSMNLRLNLFFVIFSVYETICFYWLGIFQKQGTFQEWLGLWTIILVLYAACVAINYGYGKHKENHYNNALEQYKKKING